MATSSQRQERQERNSLNTLLLLEGMTGADPGRGKVKCLQDDELVPNSVSGCVQIELGVVHGTQPLSRKLPLVIERVRDGHEDEDDEELESWSTHSEESELAELGTNPAPSSRIYDL